MVFPIYLETEVSYHVISKERYLSSGVGGGGGLLVHFARTNKVLRGTREGLASLSTSLGKGILLRRAGIINAHIGHSHIAHDTMHAWGKSEMVIWTYRSFRFGLGGLISAL